MHLYPSTLCSSITLQPVLCFVQTTADADRIALFPYDLTWSAGMSRAERLGLLLLSQLGAGDGGSRYAQYAICFCC